jgi:hypothetical protein
MVGRHSNWTKSFCLIEPAFPSSAKNEMKKKNLDLCQTANSKIRQIASVQNEPTGSRKFVASGRQIGVVALHGGGERSFEVRREILQTALQYLHERRVRAR